MARILIVEPHPEVCDLLARVVTRLGHEAIPYERSEPWELAAVDAVLLEPSALDGLEVARAAREASGAATVCVSIYPMSDQARALEPVAYLLKPFSLADLEGALVDALESRRPVGAA